MSKHSTNKRYRVEVIDREIANWSDQRRCTLGISLGAHYHERGKFRATVEWVSRNFDGCSIVLCDTLQRYNSRYYLEGDEESAVQEAFSLGSEWIERNTESLSSFSIPYKLSRWEEWRRHPEFESALERINRIYDNHPQMRSIVEADVARFIANNPLGGQNGVAHELRLKNGVRYMIEEMAGLALFAKEHGNFEVYAGPKINALSYLKEARPAGAPAELLDMRSLKIDFRSIQDQ